MPPPPDQPTNAAGSDAAASDDDLHRRGRWLAWVVILVAAGAAVGVLQVTGGLETVPSPAPSHGAGLRTVPVGEPVDVGPATITVNGVVALSDLGEVVGPPDEGKRFIAVSATVEVIDRKTWDNLDDSLRIAGVPGITDTDPGEARLIRSSQRANSLQPGLPVDVGVIFQQPLSSPVPRTVTVTLYCWQRTETEFGEWWWEAERPCAEVTVETEDRTAEIVAAPSPSPGASR